MPVYNQNRKIKICDSYNGCNGTGKVERVLDGDYDDTTTVECESCGGTGRLYSNKITIILSFSEDESTLSNVTNKIDTFLRKLEKETKTIPFIRESKINEILDK